MSEKILLFVGFGSLGDIYPLLAVANKMRYKHKVVFLANEYFRETIEQQGVTFQPIGTVRDQLAAKETEQSTGETVEGCKHRFKHIIGNSFAPASAYVEGLLTEGLQPVVISHGNLCPASLACEKYNIPMILVHYAPSQIPGHNEDALMVANFYGADRWFVRNITRPLRNLFGARTNFVYAQLSAYRIKYGLHPIPSVLKSFYYKLTKNSRALKVGFTAVLDIALVPAWFSEPLDTKLPHVKFSGFAFLENSEKAQTDTNKLNQFLEQNKKPIVFTPGSAVEDTRSFCEQIIPICRKLGSPGIFASRHGKQAFDQIPKVDDVPLLYIEHADFDALLPKSRCLIHHGGIGTIAQAIKAGIPQLVRPRMYDQPANGVRVMMYGLGGSVMPASFNADTVANILVHIESSPMHRERIPYYSNLVKSESGVDNCIVHIENYLFENNFNENEQNNKEAVQDLKLC